MFLEDRLRKQQRAQNPCQVTRRPVQESTKQGFHYSNNNYKISSIHCHSLSRGKTKDKAGGPVTSVDTEMLRN